MKRTFPLLIAISYLAFVSLGLFDGMIGIAWPNMRDTFGLSNNALGALLVGSMIGHVLSSFANGALIKRYGLAILLMTSSLLMGSGILLQSWAPTWVFLLLLTLIIGVGGGLMDSGFNTYAAARFRPRLLNWLHAAFGVGTTVGSVLMTAVLANELTWRSGYRIAALIHAAVLLCLWLGRKQWTLSDADKSTDAEPATDAAASRDTLRLPLVWISIAIFFLYAGIEVGIAHWAFTIMTESRGLTIETAGAWASLYWGSFTIGRIALGFIETNLNRLVRLALGGLTLGLLLFTLNPFPQSNIIALLISGVALAPIFPALIARTPERLGQAHAPNAIGYQVGSAGLGFAFLPGLGGILSTYSSLEMIPAFLLILAVVMAVLHEQLIKMSARQSLESAH